MSSYLKSVISQFKYYEMLGDKTFSQLSDEQLFLQNSEDENSVAIIVNHLWGNMMSRWTDFKTTDGEKEFRERDQEFEVVIKTREELVSKWKEGWNCLYLALDTLTAEDLESIIYIRNQGHTVVEAINRQLSHYSYHVGQIVMLGKMQLKKDWNSLSIPKGNSKVYNENKFSKEKSIGHFTKEYLNKKDK
ncbi:DUF1572 domain-containing protein [Flavobacteriales bacterium]|nr:DUF1572 domain-containing protein [Flavobacteriales bacterium]